MIGRGLDGAEPLRPDGPGVPGEREIRPARSGVLAHGTLACPSCDAPVALSGTVRPADPLVCPYCARSGAIRDFLSLAQPPRPMRVVVRVVHPGAVRIRPL